MLRFLKDPLIHFLAIGASLFALSAWFGQSVTTGRERILIDAAQVAKIRDAAALVNGRAPTRAELADLVEPTIREEVLYREALALHLEANDDEVRRRLVDKMQYLTQDLADPEPASEEQLRAFYNEHPERFTVPDLASFDQVFFDPKKHGDEIRADAAAAIEDLAAGKPLDRVGDRTPLRTSYEDARRDQIEVLFGKTLAAALQTMPLDTWQGPFKSDFGWHVVRVRNRESSRLPPYDEIRDRVLEEYGNEQRRVRNAAEYARIRSHYDVVVEWPEKAPATSADAASATDREPQSKP
jgi:PPIC-type PPIASE domain